MSDNDPTAGGAWNDGCDFAMTQLCLFLGVNQNDVRWDAATETVDGDVQAVIGNILRAKFGEDWGPDDTFAHAQPASEGLLFLASELEAYHDCADGDVQAGNGHFRLECVSESEKQRLNLRAVLRDAAKALRLVASQPSPAATVETSGNLGDKSPEEILKYLREIGDDKAADYLEHQWCSAGNGGEK